MQANNLIIPQLIAKDMQYVHFMVICGFNSSSDDQVKVMDTETGDRSWRRHDEFVTSSSTYDLYWRYSIYNTHN